MESNNWHKKIGCIEMIQPIFFISMFLNYFLSELNFPNGLFFAKSTNIGAATKIEE